MRYDIRLEIAYDYPRAADLGRHVLRMMPQTLPGEQSVITSLLTVDPMPDEWINRIDFFGNPVAEIAFDKPVESTVFRVEVRLERLQPGDAFDISPALEGFGREIAAWRGLDAHSPHHFVAPSVRVPILPAMTDYGLAAAAGTNSVWEAVRSVGMALHRDMVFDPDATTVDTPAAEAFENRHGVCQDFTHIMIACLRGMGIPAGYVSGFIRTEPPPGKERLEGADAMHAWVRAWCGFEMGWREFDPTNAMVAGLDHVVIARGRDYSDVTPIKGVMRMAGGQSTTQAVDVIPLD